MKLETRAVHAGDRKRSGTWVPVTTPIHTATSYFYDNVADLDRAFDDGGPSYSRHGNPTNEALEELIASLEGGDGALACASGMSALNIALMAALLDRRRVILAASALYGATINMLMKVLEPSGIEIVFVDFADAAATQAAIAEHRPGAMLMETISNPLLCVAPLDHVAAMATQAGVQLVVDSTFSSPLITRPLEFGAHFVVHSLTKYLSGHGDVLGGAVITNEPNLAALRSLAKSLGPLLGPFEAYLTMRGIKSFPVRMEKQCANACKIAAWLASHPAVEHVYFPGDPKHPDAANIHRTFAPGLYGAMVSFEIKGAEREGVFRFMNALEMIVPGTSLGDVQTMVLYPVMASHRDLSPKHRARLGIRDNLIRMSVGIEAAEDIIADLDRALNA
ncbi:MAG TPA: PLP-dependent aspartate aminotransferase family protein [Bryobacteraceae bacterium]|nr:PLP-dependent aspartate aminotransferase family protein [Bryobacteraceae bacterium]